MRIQVLELPTVVVGDLVRTPFAIVVDEASYDINLTVVNEEVRRLGAVGALIFEKRVEVL